MKLMYELIRYRFQTYIRSSQYIMPLAVNIVILAFMYTILPVSVVDSYTQSGILTFYIMVWIGLSYNNLEPPVSQQIIILHVQKGWIYYLSDSIFLALLGMVSGTICVLFPIMQELHKGMVFRRALLAEDIIYAWILHFVVGFVGSATGTFLHPRIVKERKTAIILTAAVAVVAIIKTGLAQELPVLKGILWLFPPIGDFVKLFTGRLYYSVGSVVKMVVLLTIYGVAVSAIRIWKLDRNKF